jgi:hypothetical protein
MSFKTVNCDTCGEEVSKASTLAVGGGKRACRSHSSTSLKATTQQVSRKSKEEATRQKREDSQNRWKNSRNNETEFKLTPKCSSCLQEGVHQQDFFLDLLLAGEKYELTYGKSLNPFDAAEVKKAYSGISSNCLWLVGYEEKITLSYNQRMASEMLGTVLLCGKCCEKFDIDPHPVASELTLEQLSSVGAVYEGLVRPTLRNLAAKELGESN